MLCLVTQVRVPFRRSIGREEVASSNLGFEELEVDSMSVVGGGCG